MQSFKYLIPFHIIFFNYGRLKAIDKTKNVNTNLNPRLHDVADPYPDNAYTIDLHTFRKTIVLQAHSLLTYLSLVAFYMNILGKLNLAISDVTHIFYHLRAILDISLI